MIYESQAEFMRKYNESHRLPFNDSLFIRNDEDTIRALENIILSCQRNMYFTIKVLSFNVVTSYEDIQKILWMHEESRKKKNKKYKNPYDNINLKDSDIMILQVIYYIKLNTIVKTNEETEKTLEVLIALPRYVEKYYFRLSGCYYTPIFQIVDGSTYNNNTSSMVKKKTVSGKIILNSIRICRNFETLFTLDGEKIENITNYSIIAFKKCVFGCKYLLARFGLVNCIEFLGLSGDVYITDTLMDNTTDKFYIFEKYGIYVSVYKELFNYNKVLQSLVYTIVYNILPETNIDFMFDIRYWIRMLGGDFGKYTDEKGLSILSSFDGIYDITSRELLHLPQQDKCDIYAYVRWIMNEFKSLVEKDNLDLNLKRVRGPGDYLAAHYALKLNNSLFRISDVGKGITIKQITRAIYTSPMYLIQTILTNCKMIKTIEMVNANDAFAALSFTYKGISGLGDSPGKSNAIPHVFRRVHPSQMFKVDLETSSPGDPGVSGMIVPYVQLTEDNSFSDYEEPNDWKSMYEEFKQNFIKGNNLLQVIKFKNKLGIDMDADRELVLQETMIQYKKLICPVRDVNGIIDYAMEHSAGRRVDLSIEELNFEIPDYLKEDTEEDVNYL